VNTPFSNGDPPERDATETALLGAERAGWLPVIGVCRGMQVLQHACGARLALVRGNVTEQLVRTSAGQQVVNSYHLMKSRKNVFGLIKWGPSEDGVINAVQRETERLIGNIWHPKRLASFAEEYPALFRTTFVARRELAA